MRVRASSHAGMHLNRQNKRKVNENLKDYLRFPKHPLLQKFRHEWIMVPYHRPRVPVFSSSKMPRAGMKDEEKARLCSLYWRPWTLCADFSQAPHVPHLLQMRLYPEPIVRHRMRAKSKATAEETMPSWAGSWSRYIRGNVVSEHAAKLIRRFLSLTLARSSYDGRESDGDAESGKENMEGHGADPMKLKLDDLHQILRVKEACEDDSEQKNEKEIDKLSKKTYSVRARWSVKFTAEGGAWDSSGHRDTNQIEEYKTAAKNLGRNAGEQAPRSQ